MDAILELPPHLPPHDPAPLEAVPHRVVASWPEGTFIENLAVLPGGHVVVSLLSEARLDRVTPQGAVRTLRQFDRPVTGLALMDGALHVAVGVPGAEAPGLWRVDPETGYGELAVPLPDMIFANAVSPFAPGVLLVSDSWQGRLVRVDLAARAAATWHQDEALTRAPGIDLLPGANGAKRWGAEVTVSVTGRAELHRIAVTASGAAGPARRIAERLRVDDLAYDREGRLYLTTHIGHSLDRLDRDGRRVSLGGVEAGLAGSTACAFGPDGGLYVTSTGGVVTPPGGVLQPARLVRLEVGAEGAPLAGAGGAQP